jgi:hypothetical protein
VLQEACAEVLSQAGATSESMHAIQPHHLAQMSMVSAFDAAAMAKQGRHEINLPPAASADEHAARIRKTAAKQARRCGLNIASLMDVVSGPSVWGAPPESAASARPGPGPPPHPPHPPPPPPQRQPQHQPMHHPPAIQEYGPRPSYGGAGGGGYPYRPAGNGGGAPPTPLPPGQDPYFKPKPLPSAMAPHQRAAPAGGGGGGSRAPSAAPSRAAALFRGGGAPPSRGAPSPAPGQAHGGYGVSRFQAAGGERAPPLYMQHQPQFQVGAYTRPLFGST